MAAGDSIALVVGASAEDLEHIRECLTGWCCVAMDVDGETDGCSPSGCPELIVLYARKAEKETLAICEQLRNAPETSDVPILMVISRYQIAQAHAFKRIGNASFIMTPFDEKKMHGKIAECFGMS